MRDIHEDMFEGLDNIKSYLMETVILNEERFALDKQICDITAQEYKSKNVKGILAGAIELKVRYKILNFAHKDYRIKIEKYIDKMISANLEEYKIVKMAFSERDLEEIFPLLPTVSE